ncbi:hemerythrin domain-containing protein [Ruegeria arenilitoris]|uniref:hemerythrin domain-containing protein n=1 Tax=Ruegeria arenilitoris TaxID=1173585 RepID=UPI0020C57A82|nr:hemerythrin domain-containing protein [Ruegeria arenilitoris]
MTNFDMHEADLETGALIDHILTRYHETHRTELEQLQHLAERVALVHRDDPQVPRGLVRALAELAAEMETHMAKEEIVLFPAMRMGGMEGIESPIRVMRADHDGHAESIALIRHITHDLTPPAHACGSWRRLYDGLRNLLADLDRHMMLENQVLFPRFER